MSYLDDLRVRRAAALAHWGALHGSIPKRADGGWEPGYPYPCFYCVRSYEFVTSMALEQIEKATSFVDEYEGRYLVCETCWRSRMRERGYSENEIRRMLIEDAEYSGEEADAALLSDKTAREAAGC